MIQSFRKTHTTQQRGPAAQRPVPADVVVGTIYYSEDTFVTERSNGTAWEPYGDVGLSSSVFFYRSDLTTTAANDPGAGKCRWNTATQTQATFMYFDWLTDDGLDVNVLFQLLNTSTRFLIQEKALAVKYQVWALTAPANNHPDWFDVPVAFVSGAGGNFSHNLRLAIILLPPSATRSLEGDTRG